MVAVGGIAPRVLATTPRLPKNSADHGASSAGAFFFAVEFLEAFFLRTEALSERTPAGVVALSLGAVFGAVCC